MSNGAVCASVPNTDDLNHAPLYGALAAIGQAELLLEAACHDPDVTATLSDVAATAAWLRNAQADLELTGHEDMRDLAACAAAAFEATAAAGVPAGMDLGTYQATVLTPMHATVIAPITIPLRSALQTQQSLSDDASTAFWMVLGFGVAVLFTASYIDLKQRVPGGYRRGPVGVAEPLVSYSYPDRAARYARR